MEPLLIEPLLMEPLLDWAAAAVERAKAETAMAIDLIDSFRKSPGAHNWAATRTLRSRAGCGPHRTKPPLVDGCAPRLRRGKVRVMNRLPNIITGGRLVLALFTFFALAAVPLLGAHLTEGQQYGLERWAFVAFVVAALTDFVDGWLARKLNAVSVWGAILDPIGDKVLVCGVILGLLCVGASAAVAVPAALILFREFTVSALREVTAGKGDQAAGHPAGQVEDDAAALRPRRGAAGHLLGRLRPAQRSRIPGHGDPRGPCPPVAGGGRHPDHRARNTGNRRAERSSREPKLWTSIAQGLQLTALDPTYRADPYPRLRHAREDLSRSSATPSSARSSLTRYADVRGVLTDRTLWRDPMRADDRSLAKRRAIETGEARDGVRSILTSDDPDHGRVRGLLTPVLYKRFNESRGMVDEVVERRLDALAGRETFDLIDTFAMPIPIEVIAHMLGVDEGRLGEFRAWSEAIIQTFNPARTPEPDRADDRRLGSVDRLYRRADGHAPRRPEGRSGQ